jgi:hypothetical protein
MTGGSTTCAAPACHDGVKNGQETDIDCGGPVCPKCANGLGCLVASDCVTDFCDTLKLCGPAPPSTPCTAPAACASNFCVDDGVGGKVCCLTACGSNLACNPGDGLCYASCTTDANCVATTYCSTPTSLCLPKVPAASPCTAADQCLSGSCVNQVCQ